MIPVLACSLVFAITYIAAKRSLATGLVAVISVGYVHGVFRANFPGSVSPFFFDSAALALYLVEFQRYVASPEIRRACGFFNFIKVLALWPSLLLLIPLQHFAIQLSGFRNAVFFLPFMFFGFKLDERGETFLVKSLAILNVCAFCVALYLYFNGLESLFPRNEITEGMYNSRDVMTSEGSSYRIPASFSSSHMYGGAMVQSMAFLAAAVVRRRSGFRERVLLWTGVLVSILGVFICGARYPVVVLALSTFCLLAFSPSLGKVIIIASIIGGIAWLTVANERFGRYLLIADTELTSSRIELSANSGFLDLLIQYPLGAGLGRAFGTSVPGFLQQYAKPPIGQENEYSRILVEEGLPGLLCWLFFLGWIFVNAFKRLPSLRRYGTYPIYGMAVAVFSTGFISPGLLNAIPCTALLFIALGRIERSIIAPEFERLSGTVFRVRSRLPWESVGNGRVELTGRLFPDQRCP